MTAPGRESRSSGTTDHEEFRPPQIGVVHSPYGSLEDAPHQGFAEDAEATVEVWEPYADALAGIEEVLQLTVVHWAHHADLTAAVGEDGAGAFARRGPTRPSPLNTYTGTVRGVNCRRIGVDGLDAVDGLLLVDLKPALQAER